MNIKLSEIIAPHFYDVHRDIRAHKHSEYVLKGGRGSTKSSFVAIEIILLLKKNPKMHALVCRQVKDTLKDSVYSQLLWAIDALGVADEFKCTKSPLEMTYIPTGQKIYFRGNDDPFKIKSIKPVFGYIGLLWLEELDQFKGAETVRIIEQSVLRGGSDFYCFKTFNPPISANNWANVYADERKTDKYVHHSNYLTVPTEWLGAKFLMDAEHLKETNERAYRHEYLGEATGSGGNVFENVECREITDDEIKEFERIYMGLDWGWYPDPLHWVKCCYYTGTQTLYIYDEFRAYKMKNRDAADALIGQKGVTVQDEIIADSAEPKSIADFRSYGLRIHPTVKGPDSVTYSMKWLASLRKIVIDPVRCPETKKEFIGYEYERTKDGEIVSGYPDRDNHAIDATRYALNRVWARRGQ